MLSRLNAAWMEDGSGDDAGWARANPGPVAGLGEAKDETGLAGFKSMLDDDWYLNPSSVPQQPCVEPLPAPPHEAMLLPPPMDSSSSCSPLDPSPPSFFTSRPPLSSLLSAMCSNPFELGFEPAGFLQPPQLANSHVLLSRGGSDFGFPAPSAQMGCLDFGTSAQFSAGRLLPPRPPETGCSSGSAMGFNPLSFDGFESSPFLNRPKVLRPLEVFPPVGAQPTLFQKRAASLRQNSAMGVEKHGALGLLSGEGSLGTDSHEKAWRGSEEDDGEEASFDGSGLNYDSDEAVAGEAENPKEENTKGGDGGAGNASNANSTLTGGGGDAKGKKKGLPAKNLMAERRRRKKLNDRLYMLRSVVPKISKVRIVSFLSFFRVIVVFCFIYFAFRFI